MVCFFFKKEESRVQRAACLFVVVFFQEKRNHFFFVKKKKKKVYYCYYWYMYICTRNFNFSSVTSHTNFTLRRMVLADFISHSIYICILKVIIFDIIWGKNRP